MASNKDFSRYFRAQSNYFTITHYAGNVSDGLYDDDDDDDDDNDKLYSVSGLIASLLIGDTKLKYYQL